MTFLDYFLFENHKQKEVFNVNSLEKLGFSKTKIIVNFEDLIIQFPITYLFPDFVIASP